MIALNKSKINDFQFILITFLPPAFVIGPLIVELIINTLILFFLFNIIKKNKFDFIKNKLFITLFIFYLILLLSHFDSDYFNETKVNVFFYIRFILFPFAIYSVLKTNKNYLKYFFVVLLITIFLVSFDGLVQFFVEKNILGFEKYRIDRISGFFKEDLILGSYLSRMLPLLIAISIYFKKDKKFNKFSIFVICICIIVIFLTGERAAFLKTLTGLIIIFLILNFSLKTKLLYFSLFTISILTLILTNPIIFDRYTNQLKKHLFSKDPITKKYVFMSYYYPMYQTSIKMFKDSKILGKGPKSYRYHCNDPKFVTFYPKTRLNIIDNTILKFETTWKQKGNIEIREFFVSENEIIKKNDKLFSYNFIGKDKENIYVSNREGLIKKIIKKKRYIGNDTIFELEPQNSPQKVIKRVSGCNTHPHNFYIQLLAETGLLGFIYVLSIFLFISFVLVKNIFFYKINSSIKLPNYELCILVGFFLVLWPLTTNGNFFNNWINLINFFPIGIYLLLKNERINDSGNS